jgi:hypothetical protein
MHVAAIDMIPTEKHCDNCLGVWWDIPNRAMDRKDNFEYEGLEYKNRLSSTG